MSLIYLFEIFELIFNVKNKKCFLNILSLKNL